MKCHQFAHVFASEEHFVGHYFAQFFMLFASCVIHCYSEVSAEFKGNLAPLKLGSVIKYVGQDVNYQIHEDDA